MTPVPASKKSWIYDGSVEQYPSVYSGTSVHAGGTCVGCHGGDDTKNTRAEAHTGDFRAIPGADTCDTCHAAVADAAAGGLHTTLAGYRAILDQRGFGTVDEQVATVRFTEQCTKCHVANSAGQTACGFCHVSVPDQAGGGLLYGHGFEATPSMDNQCTACHGSRVKDEYYGLNNALLTRNKAAFDEGSPWKEPSYALQPDVHKSGGVACTGCHTGDEMHGEGAPADDDRYAVTSSPACTDCHGEGQADAAAFAAVALHTEGHLGAMDCYVCHAQPYKSCFNCHTDVTDTGLPFFRNNIGDPTLEARKAAAANPDTVYPDSLMSFRAGRNPKWTGPGDTEHKEFSVLRHVPVDVDAFTYSGANALEGLIPDITALPTWKAATPHTIQKTTAITAACANCHGPDYAKYWLTDPVADSEGWVPEEYEADEAAANEDVVVTQPLPMF